MPGLAALLASYFAAFLAVLMGVPPPPPSFGPDPAFASDFPDPMVLTVGGTYFGYGTQTAWEKLGGIFPVLVSSDLTQWTYVADAFTQAPSWGAGDWWAPNVVQRGGTYYLYYSGRSFDGHHCLAVATADSPTGPFADQGPISCGDAGGTGYIDANVLLSGDAGFLYFSVDDPYHSISALPLTPDLLHAAGPRVELFSVSQDWEHGPEWTTVEGPFLVVRDGTYYLFYSGNDWRHDYAEGFAAASSPLGPFTKSERNPILHGGPGLHGPGGGSIFQTPAGGWVMAYHAWTEQGRSLHLANLYFGSGTVSIC